ncbi:hypothetical protein [Bacillus pseudomycoides]|uniref:hypothetical protein n=1 Tax=Bacillus pseudomycoides TaxID=64104 RepID=UPI000BF24F2B|nr:hypothetical protein [Bacillus pseudomycoides]PFY88279.1 hypothetical protein COL53_22400 [Bacillus pseudomycoides]
MNWYEVTRNEYSVFLQTDSESLYSIKKDIEPYYTINRVELAKDILDNSYWKLSDPSNGVITENKEINVIRIELKVLDEPEREFFVVPQEKIIEVNKPINKKWKNQVIIRLIRDIFRNYFYSKKNMSFFHGGLITNNNLGIAFMGGKKSGKTSSILSFLKYSDMDYVTNDDISIQINNNEVIGYGWPRTISIRNDTFSSLNLNREDIASKLRHPSNDTTWKNEATFVYPNELEQFLTTKVSSKCKVNYVIFPAFNDNIQNPVLEEVNKSKFAELLKLNIEPDINRYFRDFQKYFPFTDENKNEEIIKDIVNNCRGFTLNQNFKNLSKSVDLVRKELM